MLAPATSHDAGIVGTATGNIGRGIEGQPIDLEHKVPEHLAGIPEQAYSASKVIVMNSCVWAANLATLGVMLIVSTSLALS